MDIETNSNYVTYLEIKSQYLAWQEAISIAQKHDQSLQSFFSIPFDQVIFTGCGSTYYLSLAAASIFQQLTGISSIGVPASELIFYPTSIYKPGTRNLLITVSRSAETTETIEALKEFTKYDKGKSITISNYADKPLSSMGNLNFVIPEGQEMSIAQTRAFTSMYVFCVAMATIVGRKEILTKSLWELPQACRNLFESYEALAQKIGGDLSIDRFYLLGSGPRYGLACEGNLKIKEMTLTHSEPFHFYEFRHGPMSMVTPTTLIPAFISKNNWRFEERVIIEMKRLGAQVLTFGQGEADVKIPVSIPEEIVNVLYLPIIQLISFYRALSKKLNPDQPTNLQKVIKIERNDLGAN
ncbi:MAG: SIS domain-containing protein [Clostridiaceae bacterium]|nr:SIS domain-containing protein [Clostridiaceae bacterium]